MWEEHVCLKIRLPLHFRRFVGSSCFHPLYVRLLVCFCGKPLHVGVIYQPADRLLRLHQGNRVVPLKAHFRYEKIWTDYVLVERESSHGLIEHVSRLSFAGLR